MNGQTNLTKTASTQRFSDLKISNCKLLFLIVLHYKFCSEFAKILAKDGKAFTERMQCYIRLFGPSLRWIAPAIDGSTSHVATEEFAGCFQMLLQWRLEFSHQK
jgi:hypothetical protein